jgi:hypothetical protein
MLNYIHRLLHHSILACLLLALPVNICLAKTEQDIKAAYLYNFIKFIEWPESDTSESMIICILGDDSINEKLQTLNHRTIRNKQLMIQLLSSYTANEQCTILFIGQSEQKFIEQIVGTIGARPVLTISSIQDFANEGGVIGFIKMGNIVRFNINLAQANQAKLAISSKLLELANRVVR